MTFLEQIVEHKKDFLQQRKEFYSSLKDKFSQAPKLSSEIFKRVISRSGQINLIAEIKKASPSAGIIRQDFNPLRIAQIYVEHHAAALSVLTEEKYFLGQPEFIKQISEKHNIPILTKDFIIDEGQIYEARINGASAILLIVAILKDSELQHLMSVAQSLGLDCLVEVHDERELKRALDSGASIIGINNRNLKTLKVDLKISEQLIPRIPKGKIIVAESGIQTHQDVQMFKKLGAHAVLIGETFMRAKDIGKKVDELMKGIQHGSS